jgi:hypothetical protein
MVTKKIIGYAVSVAGIAVMTVGFGMIPVELKILEGVAGNYIAGAGIVLVVVGVMMSLKGQGRKSGVGSRKSGEDEVPIYEGVGKKRRVVGYRKA